MGDGCIDGSRGIIERYCSCRERLIDQDEESFARSFKAKVGSLRALEAATDVASLDFVVSMSTGTMFGSHGQTNYTR